MHLAQFFAEYAPAGLRPATRDSYADSLRQFIRFVGPPATLTNFNDRTLTRFLASLTCAPATANKHRRQLLAIWNHAYRLRYLDHTTRTRPVPACRALPTAWTVDQIKQLLTAARQHGRIGPQPAPDFWPAIILVTLTTGLRISAVMALPTARCQLTPPAHLIAPAAHQKHRAEQLIYLPPATVGALQRLAPHRRQLLTLFADWPFDRTSRQWPTLNRYLRRLLTAADLPASRRDLWHRLRRTFATHITAAANPATAQHLLGHSSPRVTASYLDPRQLDSPNSAHLLPDYAKCKPDYPPLRIAR